MSGHASAAAPARAVSGARLSRAMSFNIAGGVMAQAWFAVCGPQQIFNVFFKNHLQASALTLGLLVSLLSFSSVFSLVAVALFTRPRRRKPIWIAAHLTARSIGFVLAAASLLEMRTGDKPLAIRVILLSMSVAWSLMNASGPGWWAWIADLIPESKRATFFGRRSAIIFALNMSWIFLVTVFLDGSRQRGLAYAAAFAVSGLFGVGDILLHIWIPDPARLAPREPAGPPPARMSLAAFFEPLRSRQFVRFSLAVGLAMLSINVLAPFIPPYITDPRTVGAPSTWLGIMTVISQLAWVGSVRTWGALMDRFGRKPVVALCSLFPVAWLAYVAVGPRTYVVLLPLISLVGGVLAPGFYEGVNQLMLSLTPNENRTTYVAWYVAIIGVIGAGGSLLGGALATNAAVLAPLPGQPFHAVVIAAEVLTVVSFLVLTRIDEGRKTTTFDIVTRLATPNVVRNLVNMSIIGGAEEAGRAARALRTVEGAESDVAIEDIVGRLTDPDSEVREEAARALGRIGSRESFDALVAQLRDSESSIRPEAARALGHVGDPRAVTHLLEALQDPSVELQEAAAEALGDLGSRESAQTLLALLRGTQAAERVKAQGAEALSQLGTIEAVWEIVPLMHRTSNAVLRRQLAIALGNLLGRTGEFYRYVTGEAGRTEARAERLVAEAERSLRRLTRSVSPEARSRIVERFVEAREAFDAGDSPRALGSARDLLFLLALFRHEVAPPPGRPAAEWAVQRDQRLAVALWVLGEALAAQGSAVQKIDALLAFYLLRYLAGPARPNAAPRPQP
jgi:HEAT repeat protein